MPSQLRAALKADSRPIQAALRQSVPARRPIAIQAWSPRRVTMLVTVGVVAAVLVAFGSELFHMAGMLP